MDWERWKEFMRKRMKHLDCEERRIDFLAHVYLFLKGRTVVQDFMELGYGDEDSVIH